MPHAFIIRPLLSPTNKVFLPHAYKLMPNRSSIINRAKLPAVPEPEPESQSQRAEASSCSDDKTDN
jgi:hypothetical protein